MTIWISDKALEDLNFDKHRTPLLNDNGEEIGAYLSAGHDGKYPNIHSDQGTMWLDYIEIDEDGDAYCKISGQDEGFTICSRKESDRLKRRWEKA